MDKMTLSPMEKDVANFDFANLNTQAQTAKANIAAATSASGVTSEICTIWSKVSKYVKWAEAVPVVGKFITILADVLDSLCAAPGSGN